MDIQELLQNVTLRDVRTIQTEATLKLPSTPDTGLSAFGDVTPAGEIAINLNPISWGSALETWFRAVVESEQFKLVAAVAVLYDRADDSQIPDDVRIEFTEKVSIMAAYPYLRVLIQGLAADLRLGTMTLDVLRQGQFKVDAPSNPATPIEPSTD